MVDEPITHTSGFHTIRVSPWRLADQDWTDPDTGEFYPATFDYHSTITAVRSDGQNFFVKMRISRERFDDYDLNGKLNYMAITLQNALLTLEDFTNCSCTIAGSCEKHKRDVS